MTADNGRFKSLKFNIWYYFLLFVILLLLIIWIFQIAFLKPLYLQSKQADIKDATQEVSATYDSENPEPFLAAAGNLAREKNLEIYVQNLDDSTSAPYYIHVGAGLGGTVTTPQSIKDAYYRLSETEAAEISLIDNNASVSAMIYATVNKVAGQNIFFYVSTPLAPIDMAVGVLKNQLIIVSLIALIVAFLIAWYLSERISNPIGNMSKNAKKLAKGNYDITFKGNGYREIDELADALNYAKDELSKTDQLRKELIANISHDIRTPLTMVKAYAEMIRDLSGDNKQKRDQHTQIIIDEADRLTKLVNDMLDLSKLESGANDLNLTDFNLSNLVSAVCNRFRLAKELEGYTIEENVQEGIRIRADEIKIEQVLYNLVSNGINYTGENKTVTVNLSEDKGLVRFEVVDSGTGIPPEELKGIWERYYRASKTHKRPIKGSGLGLSIVRTILEAHKAKYGVNSTVGEGSCFYFEIKNSEPEKKGAENSSKREKNVIQ